VLRDAALLTVASAVVALAFNALRTDGIALVQTSEYDILVPCAEPGGEVAELNPADPLVSDPSSLLVDARSSEAFQAWHLPPAVSIPFDYLESTSAADLKKVTASRAARVVVYGDGDDPDSGRELAKELSGKGIRNVFVVVGGAPALRGPAPGGDMP
jgi:rhodanese-related sulfurtransferase